MRPSSSTPRRLVVGVCVALAGAAGLLAPAAPARVAPAYPPSGSTLVVEPPRRPPRAAWTQAAGGPADSPHRRFGPERAFDLASRPGAPHTLYLNFTGHDVSDSVWEPLTTTTDGRIPPWDLDGDRSSFSTVERRVIIAVWEAVAEDFAPFDVNVTTRPTPVADLIRDRVDDTRHGSMVVATDDSRIFASTCRGCSGLAFRSVVDRVDQNLGMRTGFAIIGSGWGHPTIQRYLGDAMSHEAGHHFGLAHRGLNGATYHPGNAGWAPLMGASTGLYLTQWSDGRYAGAPPGGRDPADLETIAATAGFTPDDHGGTAATATPIGPAAVVAGLIGGSEDGGPDLDVFRLAAPGPVRVQVTATGFPPNLVPVLTARSIGSARTASGVDTRRVTVPARRLPGAAARSAAATLTSSTVLTPDRGPTWLLEVSGGVLPGAPSAYGSVGHYRLTTTPLPRRARLRLRPRPVRARGIARPGRRYSARVVRRTGGYAPFAWNAQGLPRGLKIDPRTGRVRGHVRRSAIRTRPVTRITVTDAAGARATVRTRISLRSGRR